MKSKIHLLLPLIGILLLSIIVCVVWFYIDTFSSNVSPKQEVWGQFGDYFGGILNPILSFCAFLGLALTLSFQYSESRKSEQRQVEQQFDSRLFQMFGLMSASLTSVHLGFSKNGTEETLIGPRALMAGRRELVSGIEKLDAAVSDEEFYKNAKEVFSRWGDDCGDAMLSYFDTLLFVSSYIRDNSEGERQVFAARAVRSQLSQDARVLLFYSCLLSESLSFYRYLERFDYWGVDVSESTAPHGKRLLRCLNAMKSKPRVPVNGAVQESA